MACNDIYFWRQSLVLIADCIHSVGTGVMLTFPAVLNPVILSPNSTEIRATLGQASWIAASHGLSGAIGFCIIPPLMQIFGRRFAHIATNVLVAIGFLIFALANSIPALFAARIIQGLSACEVYITPIITGEYSDPKRRGYFITLKKTSVAFGALLCHSMSLFWSWRQIAFFAMAPPILAILITFLWPESPAFLALRGKYEECDKTYIWLYGDNPTSKRDLEELISAQKKMRLKNKNRITTWRKHKLMTWLKIFMKRDFQLAFIIVSVLTMIVDACGRYYMLAYIVGILMEITGDKSIATYCTIGADLLMLFALSISCFLIRNWRRRTILFTSGIISICLMLSTSLFSFLKGHDIHVTFWLVPGIILLNVFIVNAGVVPTCFAIIGEIFPLEYKGVGSCTTGIVFTLLYALVMKVTPILMEKTGVTGTYGIYAICVIVCLIVLYFILNETKDKTLQEIENEIKGNTKILTPLINAKPLIQSESI